MSLHPDRAGGRGLALLACASLLALACACGRGNDAAPAGHADAAAAGSGTARACTLQAHLRGALEARLQWSGNGASCEGGARPEGRGLRASFGGPGPDGLKLRLVFGFNAAPATAETRNVPARVTVLVEEGGRAWATREDGQCMLDRLEQSAAPGETGRWIVRARGYCIDPAQSLAGEGNVLIDRFDFEGHATYEEDDLHANQAR